MSWFKRERYKVEAKCLNCNKIFIVDIPKGKRISDWLGKKKNECLYCGCKEMIFNRIPESGVENV